MPASGHACPTCPSVRQLCSRPTVFRVFPWEAFAAAAAAASCTTLFGFRRSAQNVGLAAAEAAEMGPSLLRVWLYAQGIEPIWSEPRM